MREPVAVFLCSVVVVVGALCREALAEEAPVTSGPLLFNGCESSQRKEIARLVALDLASSTELSRPKTGSIQLTCSAGHFDIAITRADNQTLERAIDLEQLPPRARSRIVAIAVVELLAADPAESAPSAPPPPPIVAPPAVAAPAPWVSSHLSAQAASRIFVGGGAPLFGAGLRADIAPAALAFDALAEFGSHGAAQGSTHLTSLSSSASAGWSTAPGFAMLRLAGGLRAGAVRLSGEPADPSVLAGRSAWRGWGGPKLEANLALHPSAAWLVQVTAEGGYTLFSVYAAGPEQRDVELRGAWLALQLGVGLEL